MGRTPLTSELPKAIAPLFKTPETLLTGPEVRVDKVVEPLTPMLKKLLPLVEATVRIGKVWAEVEAAINRVAPVGVLELMIKALAVLSQRKLLEPAVLDAAVA